MHSPTTEQLAIIEAAKSTSANLLVTALPGSGKTSTLALLAHALKGVSILCLAFNKRTALEMKERLPDWCESKTLNSLGNTAVKEYLGRWPTLQASKTYSILSALIEDLRGAEREEAYATLGDLLRAVDQGKMQGYVPDRTVRDSTFTIRRLQSDQEFLDSLDDIPTPLGERLIIQASQMGISQAFDGLIDFNDQILIPTVFPASFPRFPLVLIDEAQDLSTLNHAMLSKVARQRLIAVGDECQSIYAFRGAHTNSMQLLREQFAMETLPLTISFRCPQTVVREAQWRAPAMRWPDGAPMGSVRTLSHWGVEDLPTTDTAIICRNNAPLYGMAIALLRAGRLPEIVGNDIGKGLLKIMSRLGRRTQGREATLVAIDAWAKDRLAKTRNPKQVLDQADCLRVFADAGETLGDAIAYAEHLFKQSGPVKLMTGHKAKGLEFHHVFFLDPHLIGTDQQEQNLRFVIQTRARESLTYVNSEGFAEGGAPGSISELGAPPAATAAVAAQ